MPGQKPNKMERLGSVFMGVIMVAEIVYVVAIFLVLAVALYFIVEVA